MQAETIHEFALRALVAAGHVSQSEVDQALAIAEGLVLPATQPPAVGVDVTDEIVDRVEQAVGMGCTAWDMVDPKELIRAAAAALRTGGGES